VSAIEKGSKVAFGKRLVLISPTAKDFDEFNGISIPENNEVLYLSTTSDLSFINVIGHKLYHALKRVNLICTFIWSTPV